MSKAPCFFYEGAYTQVCDRLKKIWQRRTWQKDAGEANVIAYENKGTLATLMLSGTIFAFGSTIASTATAGVGALVMSAETAASPIQDELINKNRQVKSQDKTVFVTFHVYALKNKKGSSAESVGK